MHIQEVFPLSMPAGVGGFLVIGHMHAPGNPTSDHVLAVRLWLKDLEFPTFTDHIGHELLRILVSVIFI